MLRFIPILILAALVLKGLIDLGTNFKTPDYEEISISEIEKNGTEGLDFVIITQGHAVEDFLKEQHKKSQVIFSITYPLIDFDGGNYYAPNSYPQKYRSKVVVHDTKAESVTSGEKVIKGRVKYGQLTKATEKSMARFCILDDDYIIIENNWSKRSIWFALFLIIVPGLILFNVIRKDYIKPKKRKPKAS